MMLELYVKPLLDFVNVVLKHSELKPSYKKSARAIVNVYWLLEKIQEHSEVFIEGLEIVLIEKRIPSRLNVSLKYLEDDVKKLIQMMSEDRYGMCTGFWKVWAIYGNVSHKEFNEIFGHKLQRLAKWQNIIRQISKGDNYITTINQDTSCFQYTLEDINKDGFLVTYDIFDEKYLNVEIEKSKKIVNEIEILKSKLADLIKSQYEFADLF